MNLSELSSLFNSYCDNNAHITGVSIDSRQIEPGAVFVAIRGERFDGHDFIQDAVTAGAIAIICERFVPNLAVWQVVVSDTVQALADIASFHRQQLDCSIIALTGSNGKTSVKEMIASILPQPAYATPGNLNNHIGVPLSVMQLKKEHQYAVFELGANHPGEIAHTAAIVKPHVTLINNIAPAHIEGFGSIDGVANAKGEIYQALPDDGIAIINDDDAYAHYWDSLLASHKTIRFSQSKAATVHAQDIVYNNEGHAKFILVTPQGEINIELAVPGQHNVSNALAAAACTYALGISLQQIAEGLSRFTGVAGRMTFRRGKHQSWIIDDTYNANLRSVLAALDVLATRQGTRIFVMGDMGELGKWATEHHQQVGVAAREHGIDVLMTCGEHTTSATVAFGIQGTHYSSQDELIDALLPRLNVHTTVLVKGSRSAAMEKIVQKLVG